jgi:hypothetical protein
MMALWVEIFYNIRGLKYVTIVIQSHSEQMVRKILGSEIVQGTMEGRKLTPPKSSEVAVKLLVGNGTDGRK